MASQIVLKAAVPFCESFLRSRLRSERLRMRVRVKTRSGLAKVAFTLSPRVTVRPERALVNLCDEGQVRALKVRSRGSCGWKACQRHNEPRWPRLLDARTLAGHRRTHKTKTQKLRPPLPPKSRFVWRFSRPAACAWRGVASLLVEIGVILVERTTKRTE